MDKAALIGRASVTAKLKVSRLRNVEARIFATTGAGGQLRNETTVALTENSDGEWISSIGIKLEGFPHEIERESPNPEQRTFLIEVLAQGTYIWAAKDLPASAIKNESELARVLGRPVYLVAAVECESLANKMGIGGISLAQDIPGPEPGATILVNGRPRKHAIKKASDVEDVKPKKRARKAPVKKAE